MRGLDWTLGLIPVLLIVVFVLLNSVRILRDYERAVIFRFGRQSPAIINPGGDGSGPGLILLIPFVDKMVKGAGERGTPQDPDTFAGAYSQSRETMDQLGVAAQIEYRSRLARL